jgi:hypothetical protein
MQTITNEAIASLREEYLDLINRQLPALATQISLPVQFDHCFARIVLDNLFNGCWYDQLSRQQPAYKQLNETQLRGAIAIARAMLRHPRNVERMNRKSLRWRAKA